MSPKLAKEFGEVVARRVRSEKHGGDDQGSWAVFVDGRTFATGLVKSEVSYHERRACESLRDAAQGGAR